MMNSGNLSPEAMIEMMKQKLGKSRIVWAINHSRSLSTKASSNFSSGSESRAKLEEMLRQGYSMQEVLNYFMKHGKTEEEERKDHMKKLQVAIKFN